ncbi:MAG: hypothetical protein JO115_16140 [Pseudonocardiales bacterium]|nr:hypothetical protein [Pseudonocardiales bacterium]
MTVVVDTSVIVKWFHAENEAEVSESRAILLFAAAARALDAPLVSLDQQLLAETPAAFASRVGLIP